MPLEMKPKKVEITGKKRKGDISYSNTNTRLKYKIEIFRYR